MPTDGIEENASSTLAELAQETETKTPADKAETDATKTETVAAADKAETEEAEEEDGYEDIRDYLRDVEGYDASKYKTPEEAIKGIVTTARRVGERDEDAAYGRAIKQLVAGREDELAAYLKGAKPKEVAAIKAKGQREYDDFPEEAQFWSNQITKDENGHLVPLPGVRSDIVSDFLDYQAASARRLNEIMRQWPKLSKAPEEIKEELKTLAGTNAEVKEQADINQLTAQYPIYVIKDGKKILSDFGQAVSDEYEELAASYPDASRVQHLQTAIKRVTKERGTTSNKKTIPVPGKRAVRTTPVAQQTEIYASLDDEVEKRLAKGEDFVKVMTDLSRREKAKVK
jgi:hypothetical protein